MHYLPLILTIIAGVLYHLFQKQIPSGLNPILSLVLTYATALLASLLILPFYPGRKSIGGSLGDISWPSFALGIVIVMLELGFLLCYRAGWDLSITSLFSNVSVALLLIPIGLLFYQEHLKPVNLIGIPICLAGLILINYK